MDIDLESIREEWENSSDETVLKAWSKDISEYSSEIQEIIKNEVEKRSLTNETLPTPKQIMSESVSRFFEAILWVVCITVFLLIRGLAKETPLLAVAVGAGILICYYVLKFIWKIFRYYSR